MLAVSLKSMRYIIFMGIEAFAYSYHEPGKLKENTPTLIAEIISNIFIATWIILIEFKFSILGAKNLK